MILVELLIENYKQYAGEHRIEFPAHGIVGVIGANGVGKTTLFEAIEWCLYQPRQIPNADVAPRGGTGHTRVRLLLEDPRDGVRYVVERTLKRERADGEIYRDDEPENRITHGPRQVTEYVARHLIGLGHDAFVSTFFTRQKELSFFGNLKETDRRREVGRLLGMETIREAQRLIGEDRAKARAEAVSLAHQYADQSAGRDFAAETAAAEETIAAQEAASAAAEATMRAASTAHTAARAELERHRALADRDAALAQQAERVAGDERTAIARREAAVAALVRLDDLGRTRETLAPLVAAEAARAAAVAALDAEQERALRQRQHQTDRQRAERAYDEAVRETKRAVEGVGPDAGQIADWPWRPADDLDPVAAAERRIALVGGLDVESACEQAVLLATCQTRAAERDEARRRSEHYAGALRTLRAERARILAEGEPTTVGEMATRSREMELQAAQAAETEARGAKTERRRLEPIAAALRAQQFDDECPTCGRPFSVHEAGLVLETLAARIAALTADEARLLAEQKAAQTRADGHEAAQRAAAKHAHELAVLDGRIRQGIPTVEDAEAEADAKARACVEALQRTGLDGDPAPEVVAAAKARAELLQRLAGTVPLLQRLARDARRAMAEADQARAALVELGTVAYDPSAHEAAKAAHAEAREAAARTGQIDDELAQRPTFEADQAAAEVEIERLAAEQARLAAERAANGFQQSALDRAIAAEVATLTAEREAAENRNAAQTALREATGQRDMLLKEQARIARLAERAETRTREADELDRMYREFTEFDRYVAARVAPALAEHTSELLTAMTDGKYDRAEFDENYGLRIFDADEKFPVEAFSGGERDVAALAARLALSRLVGGQAAHPPSFLVLDEVFGSLDQDRRTRTLDTLGALAASTDAFRQLFLISHVGDVQASPIFDEVWRVSEVDGVSRVDNVSRDGALEDL